MERYGRKYGDEKLYKESRELLMSGFSWPPRSYTCTFCKREFRSAQALGGHMNVHRRDRARLRHHSPPLLFNPSPNPSSSSSSNNTLPNLNFSPPSPPPPSPPSTFPCSTAPLTHAFPAILSSLNGHLAAPSPSFSSATFQLRRYEEMKRARAVDAFFRVEALKDFMEEEQEEEDRGRETVKIDLEIGMREDLDLELRL